MAYAKADDEAKAIENFDEALKQKPGYREAEEARRQLVAVVPAPRASTR
jgi:hypothetical protein